MTSFPSASLKSCTGTSRLSLKRVMIKQLQGEGKIDLRERDPCGYGQLVVGEYVNQGNHSPRGFSTYRYHNENRGMDRTCGTAPKQ